MAFNPIPATTAPNYGNMPAAVDAPPMSLNDRLVDTLGVLENLSNIVFETGMRLGVLQPVPRTNPGKDAVQPHSIELLNKIETTLIEMGEAVQRIRAFAG